MKDKVAHRGGSAQPSGAGMLFPRSFIVAPIVAVLGLVQGCATKPELKALEIRVASRGECQALNKSFACDNLADVLTQAGVPRDAAIQVQFVPGATVMEVITVMNMLNAAGFTGVSKTAGSSVPGDS